MIKPVELEKKIFNHRYMRSQQNFAKDLIEKFDKLVVSGLQNLSTFIDSFVSDMEDAGEQKETVTIEQKQDLLEYMYGCIIEELDPARLADFKSRDKRKKVKDHEFFEKEYDIPELNRKILNV